MNEFLCTRCQYRDYDISICPKCRSAVVPIDSSEAQKILTGDVGQWTPSKMVLVVCFLILALYGVLKNFS